MSTESRKRTLDKYNKSEKKKEADKRYLANNPERVKASQKAYREKTKGKFDEWRKQWRQSQKGKESSKKNNKKRRVKYNQWYNDKYKNDPHFKALSILRARQREALSSQLTNKSNRTMKYTGCTIKQLIEFIEKQFQEGMTWDNWGEVWQIDHIKPCALFDLTQESERYICFNYQNQRPLLAEENNKKKANYDWNPEHEALLLTIKIPVNG